MKAELEKKKKAEKVTYSMIQCYICNKGIAKISSELTCREVDRNNFGHRQM